jgi:hypothetical protein
MGAMSGSVHPGPLRITQLYVMYSDGHGLGLKLEGTDS